MNRLFSHVLEVRDGYPCRLTQRQMAWYHAQSREFADRADCTAGVCLSFVTDAPVLRFAYEVKAYCRSCNVADLFENGVHTRSVRLADMQSRGEAVFVRETTGRAQIEIHLPNTCGLRLTGFDFGDWESAPQKREKMLLLGDSILQGIQSYHPSCALANLLVRRKGVYGVNQSVGGARFEPELLEPLPFEPDSILVTLGANDAFAGDERFEETIPAYFKKLRALYPQTPISAVTPVYSLRLREDAALSKRFAIVSAKIAREACLCGAEVIDGMGLIPHTAKFFNEDGIHPNDLGFMQYALSLIEQI